MKQSGRSYLNYKSFLRPLIVILTFFISYHTYADEHQQEALALVRDCQKCHDEGEADSVIPLIAGQDENFLLLKLQYFSNDDPSSSLMSRIARGFNDDELAIISKHLSQQQGKLMMELNPIEVPGKDIYVQKCAECHSHTSYTPAILGQKKSYLINSMRDFLYFSRPMPPAMKSNILSLTDLELKNLLHYISLPREIPSS